MLRDFVKRALASAVRCSGADAARVLALEWYEKADLNEADLDELELVIRQSAETQLRGTMY